MDSEADVYQFDPERTHQGLALVIANFTDGKHKRKGAKADLKYMKKTFKRLGFKVDCHENVKSSEIVSLLNDCKQQMLKSYGCFVFAISSHGIESVQEDERGNSVHRHAIEMFDEEYIYTSHILDHFNDSNCRALRNKPKLFFIQACRIPETRSTEDHRDAGIGFDAGIPHRWSGGQDQLTAKDQADFRGSSQETDTDSDRESDVSDTDVEEDETSMLNTDVTARGSGDGEESWQNLEKRQTEILKKLKRMDNQVWLLGREYMEAANQYKEPNLSAAANQNEEPTPQAAANENREPSVQANGNEDFNSHSAANDNKEPNTQNLSEMTTDQKDDIDPAKRRHLYPSGNQGSGDDIDPARGRKLSPAAPIEITLVPCHNDMLIMFASPQGHYAIRNKTDGSYMLRLLYKCVEKYYANGQLAQNETNILDVLRDVAAEMSEMTFMGSKEYTIVPCIVHKLKKDVIFTQGNNMGSTKFTIKLSEIISSFGLSFFTWSN